MSEQIQENQGQNDLVEKIKKEKENFKKALEQEKAEKEKLALALKEKEEAELKLKEDYKTIAQKKEEEALNWKQKYEQRDQAIVTATKLGEIRKEFEKLGADHKSMDVLLKLVNTEAVKVERGDNDNIIGVYGVGDEVKRIKDSLPMVFGKPSTGANHESPDINHKPMDLEAFKSMPLQDKKKNMAEVFKAQGIELKK